MSIGILIAVLLIAAVFIARAGSAGGALLFAGVALVLFISTPTGSGLPGSVTSFFESVSEATSGPLGGER